METAGMKALSTFESMTSQMAYAYSYHAGSCGCAQIHKCDSAYAQTWRDYSDTKQAAWVVLHKLLK